MDITLEKITLERMNEFDRYFQRDPATFADMSLFSEYRYSLEETRKRFERYSAPDRRHFLIALDGRPVGEIGIKHIDWEKREGELSVHLQNDAVKNRGIGTKAERLLLAYAFDELGLTAVTARVIEKNTRSRRVLEKVGFAFVRQENGFLHYRCEKGTVRGITTGEKKMRNKLYARAALWLAAVLAAVSLSGCHGERKDALSDGNGAAQTAAPSAEITAEETAASETPESRTPEPTESVIHAAFTACSIRTARFETFRYWLYTPSNPAENMPLIVYLHGGSGKGADLEQITAVDGFPQYLRDGKLGDVRAYVLIPQLPDTEKGWLNAAAAISELIETTVSTYALDRNNISLTGHSMGGTGTWALACASPELFARIAPLSGSVRNTEDTAEKLKNVPVRAFVGAADTIVPPDSSEETVAALKAAGDDAEITVFTGADHFSVPSLTFLDESIGLVDWLIRG